MGGVVLKAMWWRLFKVRRLFARGGRLKGALNLHELEGSGMSRARVRLYFLRLMLNTPMDISVATPYSTRQ
jgi:hypothetical protein